MEQENSMPTIPQPTPRQFPFIYLVIIVAVVVVCAVNVGVGYFLGQKNTQKTQSVLQNNT